MADWSCSQCTDGAKNPQTGPKAKSSGHLNYKTDKFCRKCKLPKGDCHLCAYSDLGPKLKARAAGSDLTTNNSMIVGGGGTHTKLEKQQAKEIAELKKKYGQDKTDAAGGIVAEAAGSGADVKGIRSALAKFQKWLEDFREMHMFECPADKVAEKAAEFELMPYVVDLKAKIAEREKALSDATPTGQRAQQLDKEIKAAEAAAKKHEAAAKHSKDIIDTHTVKFNEATASVVAATAEVARLQDMKAKFCVEKGLDKIDPVFLDARYAILKDNTEATNLIKRIMVMADEATAAAAKAASGSTEVAAAPALPSIPDSGDMDLDDLDEVGDAVSALQAKAMEEDPKGNFDIGKALKLAMANKQASKQKTKHLGIKK